MACLCLLLNGLWAQSPTTAAYTPHLSFDVASIREEREADESYFDNSPKSSAYTAHGITLNGLIMAAYGLKIMSRLKDLPDWAQNIRYDLSAKSDSATDEILVN